MPAEVKNIAKHLGLPRDVARDCSTFVRDVPRDVARDVVNYRILHEGR